MKKTLVFSLCAAMTLLAACNETETWKAETGCKDNETRCDGSQLFSCSNSEWSVASDCAAENKTCGNDADGKAACVELPAEPCVPSCKDNKATRCDSEGNATVDNCTEAQVCGFDENGAPACVAKKECAPLCKDGQLTTCDENMVASTSTCGENEACGFDENGVPACVAKKECAPLCKDGQLTTCNEDLVASTRLCSDDNKVCGFDENGVPACVDAIVCAFGEVNLLIGSSACDEEGKVVTCQSDGTMSNGVECNEGVCNEGKCIRRDCDEVADGKNVCKDDKLMLCDDGTLIEDTENACADETPLCRDGEFECSAYKDCDTIDHGQNGCKDGNIVVCNDGETSVIDGGNCAESSQLCIADSSVEAGFICKTPDPTDCQWSGGLVAKNETICDGNVLKTCSANKDGVLSDGFDCASVNNGKPFCDPKLNICRDYYKCGDNDEIAHDAIVCNAKGTNKAKCNDGKLVDLTGTEACLAVDNAVSVCTFDTEAMCAFECKQGYFKKNNACEAVVTCDPVKEKYNSDDNSCFCDTDANWTGTAGSCQCDTNYLNIGNTCVLKNTCSNAHNVLDETTNTCVCDSANHWIGNVASCQCEDGFVEIEGECKAVVPCTVEHTVWDKATNTCACDVTGHWVKDGDACACADGYVNVSGECQIKRICDTDREIYDEATNTCSCDSDKGWTGTAGSCVCAGGKVQVGNICQDIVTCTEEGQIYIENANVCACDSEKGWISDGTNCVCPVDYIKMSGVCTPKAKCDAVKEYYVAEGNTCACDKDNGWIGEAGNCTCNVDNGWTENAGACTCSGSDPMIVIDGKCEVKKQCDASKHQVLDESTNECVCDSANSWEGDSDSCECTLFKNNVCTSTTGLIAGDVVTFGKYDWIVLENTSDGVKLFMKNAVGEPGGSCQIGACFQFDKNNKYWKDASIRSYLNDSFYNTDAEFSELQKARIQETVLSDEETTDKVFLLGTDEINLYKDIAGVTSFNGYYWWLRNSHPDPIYASYAYIYNPSKDRVDTWIKTNFGEVRAVVVIK